MEPDASFGRVRLAPCLGPGGTPLELTGLSVGDAKLRIAIEGSEKGYELQITQEGGRVPLNLVFSPWLPAQGGSPGSVLLGGTEVEADFLPVPGGTRIQMQFPLDRPRQVEILVKR